jgi:hypothetical protein
MTLRFSRRTCLCLLLSLQLAVLLPSPLAMRAMLAGEVCTESSDPVDQHAEDSTEYLALAEARSEQRRQRFGPRPAQFECRLHGSNHRSAALEPSRGQGSLSGRCLPLHC